MKDSSRWVRDLVTVNGAKLLSRPEMEVKTNDKGVKQHFGEGRFQIELATGEILKIQVGSNYWNEAIAAFEKIKGDTVDVVYLPYHWALHEKSGIVYFYYSIKESK